MNVLGKASGGSSERAMMAILNQQNLPRLSIPKFNGKDLKHKSKKATLKLISRFLQNNDTSNAWQGVLYLGKMFYEKTYTHIVSDIVPGVGDIAECPKSRISCFITKSLKIIENQ